VQILSEIQPHRYPTFSGTGKLVLTAKRLAEPVDTYQHNFIAIGNIRRRLHDHTPRCGGNPPYTRRVISGSRPRGIKLKKLTGILSGRTERAGTYTFTVEVKDTKIKRSKGHPATQNTATAQLSITMNPAP